MTCVAPGPPEPVGSSSAPKRMAEVDEVEADEVGGAGHGVPTERTRARTCLLNMCGLPGAGKSTLARALAARVNADEACDTYVTLVSFDEIERELSGTMPSGGDSTSTSNAKSDGDGGERQGPAYITRHVIGCQQLTQETRAQMRQMTC